VLFFLMAFSFYGTLGVFKEQNTHVWLQVQGKNVACMGTTTLYFFPFMFGGIIIFASRFDYFDCSF
jgi:hypothetical protein